MNSPRSLTYTTTLSGLSSTAEIADFLANAQHSCERESWIGRVQNDLERDDACGEASNILWGLRLKLEKEGSETL